MSDKEYHFYQYSLISDCYYQPVMPPPFSLIQRLHEVVWGKYGCPSTNSSDDFCKYGLYTYTPGKLANDGYNVKIIGKKVNVKEGHTAKERRRGADLPFIGR